MRVRFKCDRKPMTSGAGVGVAMIAVLVLLCASGPSHAVTIVNPSATNLSANPQSFVATGIARSFQTANALDTVNNAGGQSTLANHFMFNNAIHVVQPDGPNFALVQNRIAAYQLDFTIDDPTNAGYELIVDTNYRGYTTAQSHNGVQVTAVAGSMSGFIDTDTTDAVDTLVGFNPNFIPELSNAVGGTNTTSALVNVLKQSSNSYNAGTFSGTRHMALRFTTFGSNNNVFMQNFGDGEAALRFGLNPVQPVGAPSLSLGAYPGPDGESASDHGHFVNITVRPLSQQAPPTNTSAVPEPASVSSLLLALGMLVRRRRTV